MARRTVLLVLLLLAPFARVPGTAPQSAQPADTKPKLATIKGIRRTVLPEVVRVTIELDAEVSFHEERLADPDRVFFDLASTLAAPTLVDKTIRFDVDADVVRQIRVGRHPNNTTRVVLEAAGVARYSVYPLYDPYRLVVDCVRGDARKPDAIEHGPAASAAATPAAPLLRRKRLTTNWTRRLPAGRSPSATAALAAARTALDAAAAAALAATRAAADPGPAQAEAAPPAGGSPPASPGGAVPPAKNVSGGFSIARQLGLNVSRIVIDPGHGGHDPGAEGLDITEAELVLDIALRVEAILQKTPGIDVLLTRRTDDFVPLQERTAIANRENADLFLSIHANASPSPQARGIESYFLNFANNLSSAAVAARENAASGQAMNALPDFVKAIALNNKLDESRDFATQVQRALREKLRGANRALRDLGVKQAPFVVLIGAAMPSVLVEISFVTNPQEAKLLRGSPYRQRIAEALAAAIQTYQTSLTGERAAVAHQ